ncbi:hypothetical protein BJP50_31845 [Paenibacillus odorifer]|nr:hypothetical protein BJP50_31845 [Paenibacillus odorifer]
MCGLLFMWVFNVSREERREMCIIGEKTCSACGKEKALTEFSPDKRARDGKQSACRLCGNFRKRKRLEARNPGARKSMRWTTEAFAEAVNVRTNGEYTLISDYLGALIHVSILHTCCNNTYSVAPNNFLNGTRCPHCATEIKRKTSAQFKEEVALLVGDEYSVVGEYTSARAYIDMRHNICGGSYLVYPNNFLSGKRCPHCVESHGETAVRRYLIEHKYAFTPQYRFNDCRNDRPLPFDFAVHFPSLNVLIEYDGVQHFQPVSFGRGDDDMLLEYKSIQRRDRIKTTYCKAHGIPLIRISYEEFDRIDAILDESLARYSEIPPEVSAA